MSKHNQQQLKTLMMLVITMLLWASAFVGIRYSLIGYSPGSLALFRYFIASICMLWLYLPIRHKRRPNLKELISIFILGTLGFGVYNVGLNYGEITVPAGIASFIISLVPLCMVLLATLFLHEKISKKTALGIAISLIGVVLIAYGETEQGQFDFGVIYVLVAMLAGACYSVAQKPLLKKFKPIEFTALAIWSGTLVMMIFAPTTIHEISTAPISATIAVIYMGIFPGAVAYAAWSYVLSQLPASQASQYLYYLPLLTTLMGWAVLGEIPALISLAGGLLAMIGAIVARKRRIA